MLTVPKPKDTLDFRIEGEDTVYSIPYAKDLPVGYTERLAALKDDPNGREALDLLRELFEIHAPGAWDRLSIEGVTMVMGEWAKGLGEA